MELLKGSHFIYYVVICMNLKKSKDTVWFLYYNLCCEKLHSFYNSYTICLFYLYLKTIYMKQSVYVNYWSFMRWLHSHFSCISVWKHHASCPSYTWAVDSVMLRAALWQNFHWRQALIHEDMEVQLEHQQHLLQVLRIDLVTQ